MVVNTNHFFENLHKNEQVRNRPCASKVDFTFSHLLGRWRDIKISIVNRLILGGVDCIVYKHINLYIFRNDNNVIVWLKFIKVAKTDRSTFQYQSAKPH